MEKIEKKSKYEFSLPDDDNKNKILLPANAKAGRPKKSLQEHNKHNKVFYYFRELMKDYKLEVQLKEPEKLMKAHDELNAMERSIEWPTLERWIETYVSDAARKKMLGVFRQRNLKRRAKLKNITVSSETLYQLQMISNRVSGTLTNDEIIRLSLQLFEKKEIEKYSSVEPLKGERERKKRAKKN